MSEIRSSRRKNLHTSPQTRPEKTSMTLDRVISRFGLASRTVATEWIKEGRVRVNGRVERELETWIQKRRDQVTVDGWELTEARKIYVMLNKPTGVITSFGDPSERKTVYDYLQDLGGWVFPVGRLDKDSSGLLLLTNDTDFGNRLTDPQSKVPKQYLVKVNARLTHEELQRLRDGLEIGSGRTTLPCGVHRLRDTERYSWIEMKLTEGRNRQIRRMIEALGHKVLKLVRIRIGHLSLGDLPVGKWRRLSRDEVRRLRGHASNPIP